MSQQYRRGSGLVIAFSGLDCAGKSTQIDLIRDALTKRGCRITYLWLRGGYTPRFVKLKSMLRKSVPGLPPAGRSAARSQSFQQRWVRRIWLAISLIDLLWILAVELRLLKLRRKIIICDRYLTDTMIDFIINFSGEDVRRWVLWKLLTILAVKPDASFFLTVSVEVSLKRSLEKDEPFPDTEENLESRWKLYHELTEQMNIPVLDGMRSREDLFSEISTVVFSKLTE